MFEAAIKYIEQRFPNPKYSEVEYLQSIPVAGGGGPTFISFSYNEQAARGIFYQWLYTNQLTANGIFTFTDQYNKTLFRLTDTPGDVIPLVVPITQVKDGHQVFITCSGSAAGDAYPFSISLQYIM
jgi:hypothetical protein